MTTGRVASGTAPPARPVPEPRATNGRPWRRASRTQACTSAVDVGKHTTGRAPRCSRRRAGTGRARSARRAPGPGRARPAGRPRARAGSDAGVSHRQGSALGSAMAAKEKGRARRPPRVGLVRGPRRGPHLGLRRHVPALSTWTCIFGNGCHGVLTGPAARARAGLLHLRRPLHRRAPTASVERHAERAHPTSGSSRRRPTQGGIVAPRTTTARGSTRVVDGACIFLNRPGFPGGARLRPPRAGAAAGRATARLEARRVLAAPAAPRGAPTTTATSPRRCASGSAATGATAASSSTGGAPTAPRPSSASTRLRTMRDEIVEMIGEPVYELLARQLK